MVFRLPSIVAVAWLLGAPLGLVRPAEPARDAPPAACEIECDFIVQAWRKEQGLPSNEIRALLQGRDGYLWIATRNGLARFDGARFTVFSRANTPEMPDEVCTSLAEDPAGGVWIGTFDGLLRCGARIERFDLRAAAQRQFPNRNANPSSRVPCVWTCQDGRVAAGTYWGLFLAKNDQSQHREFRILPTAHPEPNLGSLAETSDGRLWVGDGNGLWCLDPGQSELAAVLLPVKATPLYIHAVVPDPGGDLYVIIGLPNPRSGDLWRLGQGLARRPPRPTDQANGGARLPPSHLAPGEWTQVTSRRIENGERPLFLSRSSDGAWWFPAAGHTLVRLKDGSELSYRLPHPAESDYVQCLTEDREGNLWLGTESSGLFRLRPRHLRLLATADGLGHDNAWAVCETRDGSLWIGTDGGVSRWRAREGTIETWNEQTGLSRNAVRALAEDAAGRVWVGTGNGLNVIGSSGVRTIQFPGEWFNTKTRALWPARDGGMWVGTAVGLHHVTDTTTNSWHVADGLPAEDVAVLLEDRAGDLWVGTAGGGLARRHAARFETFGTPHGLRSPNVGVLFDDREGRLWVGTDAGLHYRTGDRFVAFAQADGLPDNTVNAILEDDAGWLWIGHDHGIYRVRKDTLTVATPDRTRALSCLVYDEHDGLPALETNGRRNQPAAWKRQDGTLWFCTTKGVVGFDPRAPPDVAVPPAVVIEEARANGLLVYQHTPGAATNAAPLGLPPGSAHILEIAFTGATFVRPDATRFRYRLEGLDPDWIEAGTTRKAYYANLPPGAYRFRVAAANKHGVWSDPGALLALQLEPHLYQARWFLASATAGALLLALAAYRVRVGHLRRLHLLKQQAALAAERARLAKDLHDQLGASLTQITLLSGVGDRSQPTPADVQARFEQLSVVTREALHALRDLIWTTNPAADSLERLVMRICAFAENLLAAANIRCHLDLPATLPVATLPGEVRHEVFLAVKEVLNNAVRHSGASNVRLQFLSGDSAFRVVIEDDGCGFDPGGVASSLAPGQGQGLSSVRERLARCRATFKLESTAGHGTRVELSLPLGRAK